MASEFDGDGIFWGLGLHPIDGRRWDLTYFAIRFLNGPQGLAIFRTGRAEWRSGPVTGRGNFLGFGLTT